MHTLVVKSPLIISKTTPSAFAIEWQSSIPIRLWFVCEVLSISSLPLLVIMVASCSSTPILSLMKSLSLCPKRLDATVLLPILSGVLVVSSPTATVLRSFDLATRNFASVPLSLPIASSLSILRASLLLSMRLSNFTFPLLLLLILLCLSILSAALLIQFLLIPLFNLSIFSVIWLPKHCFSRRRTTPTTLILNYLMIIWGNIKLPRGRVIWQLSLASLLSPTMLYHPCPKVLSTPQLFFSAFSLFLQTC